MDYAAASAATVPQSARHSISVAATGKCVVVQPGRNSFPDMTAFVVEHFGCDLLQLVDYESHVGQSKWTHLRGLARQSLQLLRSLRQLRDADCVITVGPVSHGHFLKLLRRLQLVHFRRSVSLGWYIHSPRFFPLFRLLGHLDGPDDHYILFSEHEIALYHDRLGIDRERMHWLPYGTWGPETPDDDAAPPADFSKGGYYFAGGYSNRDYLPLVEAFRHTGKPLVIICSAVNTELDGVDLPANVTVLRDVPSNVFDAYVRHAKACIIPLKRDTGASGQSVTLRAMRLGKPIVAPDFGGVRGYIADRVSGYLVRDMAAELPGIVAEIERDPAEAARLGDAARQRYREHFSPEAGRAALASLLSSLVA